MLSAIIASIYEMIIDFFNRNNNTTDSARQNWSEIGERNQNNMVAIHKLHELIERKMEESIQSEDEHMINMAKTLMKWKDEYPNNLMHALEKIDEIRAGEGKQPIKGLMLGFLDFDFSSSVDRAFYEDILIEEMCIMDNVDIVEMKKGIKRKKNKKSYYLE